MNFVEIIRGIGNVLLVMIIAGGVAYVGDRVGHQVGRKRLTIFNIRPRYTSTIIAIGTGMVIALVVTLVAIFASQQVKTAFFKLNSINQQIDELQARQRELEAKVANGNLIVPVDTLMVPYATIIKQSASASQRLSAIQEFYSNSVQFINTTYPRLGLRPYQNPPDIQKRLENLSNNLGLLAKLSQADALLSITSDQNLFEGDQIHFAINPIPDVKIFSKGDSIYTLQIPGNAGANADLAIAELQGQVSAVARQRHLPKYLAGTVQPIELLPNEAQMQQMLSRPGNYLMTAYAAEDVYPHIGRIRIIIVLTQQP